MQCDMRRIEWEDRAGGCYQTREPVKFDLDGVLQFLRTARAYQAARRQHPSARATHLQDTEYFQNQQHTAFRNRFRVWLRPARSRGWSKTTEPSGVSSSAHPLSSASKVVVTRASTATSAVDPSASDGSRALTMPRTVSTTLRSNALRHPTPGAQKDTERQ
eukprot:2218267-Rhodomonas_salina.1